MTHTGGASQKKHKKAKRGTKRPICRRHAHRVRRVTHSPPPGPISLCSVSVTLTLTCRRLLPGISIFSSARLFVSLAKIYSTTACLPPSTPASLSMVTKRISRSAVLPRLTAAEEENHHFQGLQHSLNTPTFY
jgi:hypothetical protein